MMKFINYKHRQRIYKNSGTHASDTSKRSVPANVHKSLHNDLSFIENLPNLVFAHSVLNDGVLHDEKYFKSSYSGIDNSYSNVGEKRQGQGQQGQFKERLANKVKQVVVSNVARKGIKSLSTVVNSSIPVSLGKSTIKVNDLRDVQRMVCEDRKRTRQFVFANSGGGHHHKKHIHKDETSKIRCY